MQANRLVVNHLCTHCIRFGALGPRFSLPPGRNGQMGSRSGRLLPFAVTNATPFTSHPPAHLQLWKMALTTHTHIQTCTRHLARLLTMWKAFHRCTVWCLIQAHSHTQNRSINNAGVTSRGFSSWRTITAHRCSQFPGHSSSILTGT